MLRGAGRDGKQRSKRWCAGAVVRFLMSLFCPPPNHLQLALALLKPGKDCLLLVAVAGGGLAAEAATRSMLHRYLGVARGAAVDCAAEMLVSAALWAC